jgi:hypothetical protein
LLNEKDQTQKEKYCMISFIYGTLRVGFIEFSLQREEWLLGAGAGRCWSKDMNFQLSVTNYRL